MLRVTIGDQTFITNDEIAHSIVKYADALHSKAETDTVEIPTVDDDGEEVMVSCHLGVTPVALESMGGVGVPSQLAQAEKTNRASTRSVPTRLPSALDPYDL